MFRAFAILAIALGCVAACNPAKSEDQAAPPTDASQPTATQNETPPESAPEDEFVFSMVYNEALLDTLIETKVYAEFCGNEFDLLEMAIIEEGIDSQTLAYYSKTGESIGWDVLDEKFKSARERQKNAECGANLPISARWEMALLPKMIGSISLVKASSQWDSLEPYEQEVVTYMEDWLNRTLPSSAGDVFLSGLDVDDPRMQSAAKNFLKLFFNKAYAQKHLFEKGYRTFVRAPRSAATDIDHRYGLYNMTNAQRPALSFKNANANRIHWRLLDVRSSAPVIVIPAIADNGRLRIIGFQHSGPSALRVPYGIALLAQPNKDNGVYGLDDSRADDARFAAEMTNPQTCPGDFCATFGEDLTDWVSDPANRAYAAYFELYIGSQLAFPISDERDPDHSDTFLWSEFDLTNAAEDWRKANN